MALRIFDQDDEYILSHCTKFLARDNVDARHNFDHFSPDDARSRICETWRFPIIDTFGNENVQGMNQVTFVYDATLAPTPLQAVAVIGSFANLYEAIPLRPVLFQ